MSKMKEIFFNMLEEFNGEIPEKLDLDEYINNKIKTKNEHTKKINNTDVLSIIRDNNWKINTN